MADINFDKIARKHNEYVDSYMSFLGLRGVPSKHNGYEHIYSPEEVERISKSTEFEKRFRPDVELWPWKTSSSLCAEIKVGFNFLPAVALSYHATWRPRTFYVIGRVFVAWADDLVARQEFYFENLRIYNRYEHSERDLEGLKVVFNKLKIDRTDDPCGCWVSEDKYVSGYPCLLFKKGALNMHNVTFHKRLLARAVMPNVV